MPSDEAKAVLAALNQISVIRPMPEQRLEVIDKAIAELIRDRERLDALGDPKIWCAVAETNETEDLRAEIDRAVEESDGTQTENP